MEKTMFPKNAPQSEKPSYKASGSNEIWADVNPEEEMDLSDIPMLPVLHRKEWNPPIPKQQPKPNPKMNVDKTQRLKITENDQLHTSRLYYKTTAHQAEGSDEPRSISSQMMLEPQRMMIPVNLAHESNQILTTNINPSQHDKSGCG